MPKTTSAPKLELKNIVTFRGSEGYGLNADLFVNGKKICFIRDMGDGGVWDYDVYGDTKEERKNNEAILQMVSAYAEGLPERELDPELGGGTFRPDLDTLINDLFAEKENKKAEKKMQKKMETHIMLGVPGASSYRSVKLQKPIKEYPVGVLQNFVNQLKPRMKRGEVFLNTNFPEGVNAER